MNAREKMRRARGGQPSEVWTPQRRRSQSKSIEHAWSKKTPEERMLAKARSRLAREPIDEDAFDECYDKLVCFLTGYVFVEHTASQFRALALDAGIDERLIPSFRAQFLVNALSNTEDE